MKWLVVVVLFFGDVPTSSKIFRLDPERVKTAADCEVERFEMMELAAKMKADAWMACVEVQRPPAAKGEPGTEERS
jgi:hypothetical protein